MKPSQIVNKLRLIATSIDNSKQPNKFLVANDIRQIVAILLNSPPKRKPSGTPKTGPVDPEVYVVRSKNGVGYHIVPFDSEALIDNLANAPILSKDDVINEVYDKDISLVTEQIEWDVEWMHGNEITGEMLDRIT